jgi:hypothetical protein
MISAPSNQHFAVNLGNKNSCLISVLSHSVTGEAGFAAHGSAGLLSWYFLFFLLEQLNY